MSAQVNALAQVRALTELVSAHRSEYRAYYFSERERSPLSTRSRSQFLARRSLRNAHRVEYRTYYARWKEALNDA